MPYAPLVSKIRCHNPNKKSSAIANRNGTKYIATRAGVDLSATMDINALLDKVNIQSVEINETLIHKEADNPKYLKYIAERPRSHGLFGNIDCTDLDKVCAIVYNETKKGKNIYRGIISLSEKDAALLGFQDKQHWETYLRSVMPDVAQKLGISTINFTWVAAFHAEQSHPHVHYEMWANDNRVKSSFIHTSVQKDIRSFLSEHMFTPEYERTRREILSAELPEYQELISTKNSSREEITEYFKSLTSQISETAPGIAKVYLPYGMAAEDLERFCSHLQTLAAELPSSGRLSYKFMPPDLKSKIDIITESIISRPDIAASVNTYVENAGKISKLNGNTKSDIEHTKDLAKKEIYNRCGNILIKAAKELRTVNDNIQIIPVIDTTLKPQHHMEFETHSSTNEPITNISPDTITSPSVPIPVEDEYIWRNYFVKWSDQYRKAIHEIYNDGDLQQAFDSLEKEAISGNALAINEMAKVIERELVDIPQNEANEYYNEALIAFKNVYNLELKNEYIKHYSAYRLGKLYEFGKGDIEIDYESARDWYEKSNGNKFAQYSLAKLYLSEKIYLSENFDLTENQKEAFKLLQSSSEQGNPFSAYELGNMYSRGIGVEFDEEKSFHYYSIALKSFLDMSKNSTDDSLFYKIGIQYLNGLGTAINVNEAELYLKKAADLGNANAKLKLASIYFEKDDIELKEQALKILVELADNDNAMAQYKLGCIYSDEEMAEFYDINKALIYFKQAAEQENQFAQYRLGCIYANAEIPKVYNIAKAIYYLELAAKQGNEFARYRLGCIYSSTEMSDVFDITKAINYLEQASKQGNQFAQYQLGRIYANAEIPAVFDITKAVHYLELAFQQGNEFAQYRLGCIWLSSEYGHQDIAKGISILEDCSKRGNVYAQYKLGVTFLYGKDGAPHDEHIGRYWLHQASEAGYEPAEQALIFYDEYKASIVSSMGYQAFRNIASYIATATAEQQYYANISTPQPSVDSKQALREAARKHGAHIEQDE